MNTAACEKEAPSLSRDEAIAILDTPDEELESLIDRASSLRYKYKGNRVSIHILTNARSGNCSQDCAYCAQSCRSTADIDKYKWVDEDKLYQDNDFVNDYHLSRHCIGLSGMKFTDKEIEELARRIRKMKEHGTHLCCSIGFLTEHQAKMLKEAGLDRINHNLNSSRSFYHNICSTHTFDQRVRNIHMLQGLGFEICSGGIIGMGESKEDVVDMLLELREIQPGPLAQCNRKYSLCCRIQSPGMADLFHVENPTQLCNNIMRGITFFLSDHKYSVHDLIFTPLQAVFQFQR